LGLVFDTESSEPNVLPLNREKSYCESFAALARKLFPIRRSFARCYTWQDRAKAGFLRRRI
jgi:hypothetical protein